MIVLTIWICIVFIMVFTAAQQTAFFTQQDQMNIPAPTRLQLVAEGITFVEDLAELTEENLKIISDNLRRPTGRITDPNANPALYAPVNVGGPPLPTIQQPPFVFGAISYNRLKVSAELVRYYQTVDRALSAANMQWNPIGRAFDQHWKALETRKKEDDPETPKITRGLNIVKWSEAFHDFLHRVIGARTIPLAYVIRMDTAVPAAPALATNQPYATEHGSVEGELIARASHTHPLFRDDNAQVYFLLEEATRSTGYAASIKPYQRAKNGRGAWLALVTQYAGEDKWRALIRSAEEMLHSRKWRGNNNTTLERFIGQHRTSFVTLSQCAEHINYQLPNESTRVTHLLDNIECGDAPLQAAMALVRNDTATTGKMNDFEATASFILPHCPVAKKRQTPHKRPQAEISSTNLNPSKPRVGTTGVELRFHTKAEYRNLRKDQKDELRTYRDKQQEAGHGRLLAKHALGRKGTDSSQEPDKKRLKAMISSAVKEALSPPQPAKPPSPDLKTSIQNALISALEGLENPTVNPDKHTGSAPNNSSKKHAAVSSATATADAPTVTALLQRIKKNRGGG